MTAEELKQQAASTEDGATIYDKQKYDFTEYKGAAAYPAGWYPVEVADVEVRRSKKGKKFCVNTFRVFDGENTNATFRDNLYQEFDEGREFNGLKRIRAFCIAIGLITVSDTTLEYEPAEFVGKKLWIEVEQKETDQGGGMVEMQNQVKFLGFRPIAAMELPSLSYADTFDEPIIEPAKPAARITPPPATVPAAVPPAPAPAAATAGASQANSEEEIPWES